MYIRLGFPSRSKDNHLLSWAFLLYQENEGYGQIVDYELPYQKSNNNHMYFDILYKYCKSNL